ncbi:MAG: DUF2059 domain-containing protein [Candidatus Schekmanbacteria bacterium]|nr:MAG: DUF2059 domain-containing protein [Candidatus Schekmanbacteria bacterium]
MKIKSIVIFIFAFILLSTIAFADKNSHRKEAEELLLTMKTDKTFNFLFEQQKKMMKETLKNMGINGENPLMEKYITKMIDLFKKEIGWNKMKEDYIDIYTDTFSEDELKEITKFYKSPVGSKFIEKMPILMQKTMAVSQKKLPQIVVEIKKIESELIQELKEELKRQEIQKEKKVESL